MDEIQVRSPGFLLFYPLFSFNLRLGFRLWSATGGQGERRRSLQCEARLQTPGLTTPLLTNLSPRVPFLAPRNHQSFSLSPSRLLLNAPTPSATCD